MSAGYRALAILLPLFVLALASYIVRIWTRVRLKHRLNAADYTLTIAALAESVSIVLTIVAVSHGFGCPLPLLSPSQIEVIGATTFTVFIIALWASSFARISILCLLLQIAQEHVWRWVLWSGIALQGTSLAACIISQLVQCRPIRSMWASVPEKTCVPTEHIWIVAWVFSGIAIISDLLCAVLPSLLIRSLHRPLAEKVLLSVLMGLCLIATIAGIFKVLVLKSYDATSENAIADMMTAYLWHVSPRAPSYIHTSELTRALL
ncbi:hypothetical protein B0T25DRAFT_519867 [Lasiosphaeria hispida]|uniref:Rhodopsin domain-containing protein n=1 Tax=Lasiosphaeria hispida TaxID=260671 RepID=A0AAJ0HFA5_9PEZI|nr:hypothetical protein B0T25DRAFT_519867 [Lasiosphaeria hispida]